MCGIFGVLVGKKSNFTPAMFQSTVNHLFKLSESRGKEASGLAIYSGDAIQVYKRPIPASSLIRSKEYKDIFNNALSNGDLSRNVEIGHPVALIGHSRLVTQGGQNIHHNNQPVITNGLVGIHNGIITNDRKLWEQFPSIKRQYDIDTEVLLSLIRLFYNEKNSLVEAIQTAFSHIQGYASIAVLLEDFNHMILATNNGSLYTCSSRNGDVHIFASERYILNSLICKRNSKKYFDVKDVIHVGPGCGYLFNLENMRAEKYSLKIGESSSVAVDRNDNQKEIIDVNSTKLADAPPRDSVSSGPFILPESFVDEFPKNEAEVENIRRCTKCILPETMPFIEFDGEGVCNYCHGYKIIVLTGKKALDEVVKPYRSKSGEPDCLISLSGGRDSSYGVHYVKTVLKMNPIAYTYDWGMVTDLARRNQSRVCGKLGIEHILVSANIDWKRENIRKNVTAWLNKPDLGTVPIFMAGDKQYYYYANKVSKQIGCDLIILCENMLEISKFKLGYAGAYPNFEQKNAYTVNLASMFRIAYHYGTQYIINPGYINSSILDTIWAYLCFFTISHNYLNVFHYVEWNEEKVDSTLISEYDWELAKDTKNTWRIGDGTTPFYNYIYYTMSGFTENDTLRSNQIREGLISREEALKKVKIENRPRYESIQWYCNTIGVDFKEAIKHINAAPKRYIT